LQIDLLVFEEDDADAMMFAKSWTGQ